MTGSSRAPDPTSAGGPQDTVTRTCAFGPLRIDFDDSVLEPREWTMRQSFWAAELLHDLPKGRVLELCSGAGHIGLLALHLSGRDGLLVDLDEGACRWSRHNADAAGLAEQVEVRQGDVAHVLRADERFPFVLIDPPWVPHASIHTFPADPVLAIDGGEDGLAVARRCLAVAAAHLLPQGAVLLQLGTLLQADALKAWLQSPHALPLRVVEVRPHDDRGVLVLLRRTASSTARTH